MNYINKGKRDILIFPKFDNIDKIQEIRQKYDELYSIISPHITLAFPFKSEITNHELKEKLQNVLAEFKPFKITCSGISLKEDKKVNKFYIFLNVIEGSETLKSLHEKIYAEVLNKNKITDYTPHITIGATANKNENIELNEVFSTTISSIAVESIGENEESIIEFEIKL